MKNFIILLIIIINTSSYSQNSRIDICHINYDILDFQEVINKIIENEISLSNYDTIYFYTEFTNYKVKDYLLEKEHCYFKPFLDIDLKKLHLSVHNIEILRCNSSKNNSIYWVKPFFSVSYPVISALDGNLVIMVRELFKSELCEIKYVFKKEFGNQINLISREQISLSHLDYRAIDPELIKEIRPDTARYKELMKKLDKGMKKFPKKK